jgi:hypothetical protein
MGTQQRRRNASFSVTIPVSLLPEIDDAASLHRSRNAFVEQKIIQADTLCIYGRITGSTFTSVNSLGRSLKSSVAASRRIEADESSNLINSLSRIRIALRSKDVRRSHPVDLDGPTEAISVRTLPSIKAVAETNAQVSGLSLSAYCLRLVLGHPVFAKPSQDDARIISEVGKISGLLTLCDQDHLNLFANADHHRHVSRMVADLLSTWRQ